MTNIRCQSKNPGTCRYHGNQSTRIVRALRDKVVVAHSVYQSALTSDEKFSAYATLRAAEIDYYATNEGSERLRAEILKSVPGDHRDMLTEIQANSLAVRTTNELADSDHATTWGPPKNHAKPTLPKASSMSGKLNDLKQMVYVLSEGKTPSGKTFDFKWNAATGYLSYEEKEANGEEDTESRRFFGRVGSQQEAWKKAEKWYQFSVVR